MKLSPKSTGTSRGAAFPRAGEGGFSLVELMVAMAILALMLSIIGVMIGVISRAFGDSRKLLNSDDQARSVFIRMASDFSRMLTRKDVDVIFAKQQNGSTTSGSNDSIYFVTEGSGSNINTSYFSSASANILSLAGYCIAPDAQGAQISPTVATPLNDLNRLGHALTWDTANASPDNLVFVSFAAPTQASSSSALITSTTLDGHWGASTSHPVLGGSPTYIPPTSSSNYGDYHAVGDQVFRFEYCFQLKDGTYSNFPILTSAATQNQAAGTGPPAPTNDSASGYTPGSRWFDATNGRAFICYDATKSNAVWGPLGVQDVSAIIVGIALLDRDSRLQLTNAATMNSLPSFFADSLQATTTAGATLSSYPVAGSKILMQQNWQTTVDSPTFAAAAGLTASAAGHIRIYQRYFYLNGNNL